MSAIYFLPPELLPPGFAYPESYRRYVKSHPVCVGAVNQDWCFLDEIEIERFVAYAKKIATRSVVPFMRRNGEDGVACFDGEPSGEEPRVYQFNYCESIGFGGGRFTFDEWLASIPVEEDGDE